jgi:uncharacterized protein DUF2630
MDEDILQRINQLVDEEHHLQRHTQGDGATDEDHRRLRDLEVRLDQCWDLLRQRRARRAAGLDPDGAQVRDEKTVEGYTA